jgi:RNA polymerase-associated protein
MLGEEFSLVDCVIAPFLWRLPVMGIELPHQAQSVIDYGNRLFSRPAFAASLTEAEKDMRRK